MKLSILVVLAAFFILISGFQNPAFFFIGYLWTSILYPSAFATTFFPLSMIFGISWVVGYFFIDKSNAGKLPLVFYLMIAFAIWVTFYNLARGAAFRCLDQMELGDPIDHSHDSHAPSSSHPRTN